MKYPVFIGNVADQVTYKGIKETLDKIKSSNSKYVPTADMLASAKLYTGTLIAKAVGDNYWLEWLRPFMDQVVFSNDGAVFKPSAELHDLTEKILRDAGRSKNWIDQWAWLVSKYQGLSDMDTLIAFAQAILGASVMLCPVDTGRLRSSGRVVIEGNETVRIEYNCPYASYVHENLYAKHLTGQAKFLETAAQSFIPNQATWVHTHSEGVWIRLGLSKQVEYGHYDS